MEYQTATEQNGSLVLPPEVQQELGIPPGSPVYLQVEDSGVRITTRKRPKLSQAEAKERIQEMQRYFAGADSSPEGDPVQMRKEEAEHSLLADDLDQLCGICSGSKGLEEDLYTMRREEEEHFQRKFGC